MKSKEVTISFHEASFNHNIIVKLSRATVQYCARYTSRLLSRTLSRNRLQHQAKPLASPFCEGW